MTYHVYSTCSVRLWPAYTVYHKVCHSGDSCNKFMTALGICLYPHNINMFIWCATSKTYCAATCDSEQTHPHVWIWVWAKNTLISVYYVYRLTLLLLSLHIFFLLIPIIIFAIYLILFQNIILIVCAYAIKWYVYVSPSTVTYRIQCSGK